MKESFDFSLMDFLAYLFPGTIMILMLAALVSLSPFASLLHQITLNLAVGLVLIACAYCVGVSISSVMASVENVLLNYFGLSDPTTVLQFGEFDDDVKDAFTKVFGDRGSWSSNHFVLARALVYEKMPRWGAVIERQASLRQLRRNLVLPTLLLGIVGVVVGAKLLIRTANHPYWGVFVIAIALLGAYTLVRALIKNGMYGNRRREMREVCSGLVVYAHSFSVT